MALKGLKCASPVQIAHVSETTLRDCIDELNDSSVQAIVQVGINLAMVRLAGIADRVEGFGSPLADYQRRG